jgi:sec-independent protein translocase protein TatA
MIGDLFDSPWKILIIALVIIVLFGSRKLPDAARSLGRSMRILKREVSQMHDDDDTSGTSATAEAPAQIEAKQQPVAQAQIDELQKQIRDLQSASGAAAANGTPAAEARPAQQSG